MFHKISIRNGVSLRTSFLGVAVWAMLALSMFPVCSRAATLSVSSPQFRLRTAIGNPIDAPVGATQAIAYSTRWDSPEAGGVQVTATAPLGSSETLFSSSASAEGTLAWTPLASGYHVLTHATTTNRTVTFRIGTLVDIVYDAEGGTPATQTRRHVVDAPFGEFPISPTRAGYSFAGWWTAQTGGTKVESNTIVAGAVTLHARWTANTYIITLDTQQGSGGTASVTVTYGNALPKISIPTRTGYTFGGYWSASNGGGTQYYTAAGTSSHAWDMPSTTTLYAKWSAQSYVVKLDAQGGTGGPTSVTATYGSALPSITIPKRPGYVFAGYWSASGGTGTQYYAADGTGLLNWNKASATTLFAHWTDPVFHVDAAAGDDNNDGFTWQTAKASIQAAIDEARDGGRILVNDGVYEPISTVNYSRELDQLVGKSLEIVSVNGAARTAIDASLTSGEQCAKLGQVAQLTWKPTGPQAILEGFTLRGARPNEDTPGSYVGAGAIGGILRRCVVTDNQTGANGGGVASATCEGCTISGNKTSGHGGGAYYCTLTDCVVEDNESSGNGGGAATSCLERCVVCRNTSAKYGGGQTGGDAVDCLFEGNEAMLGGGAVANVNLSRCTVVNNHTDGTGGGAIGSVLHSSILWNNAAGQQDNNCNTSRGAYTDTEPLLPGRGNISADPRFQNAVSSDYRLSADSPCIDVGFGPTDTTRKDLAGNQRWQGTRMDMGAYETVGSSASAFPIADWWVDAVNGRDEASGTSREAPLATIQAAVERASDGSTIHVLPGTYEPFSLDRRTLTVQSTDGAEKTIVHGGDIAQCAWLGSDSKSVLVGLTLCNGYAFEEGGGVVGGTLRECIIRDNTADWGGGGACGARLDRCILMGNSTRNGSGGGALGCDLSNCLVYRNSAVYGGGIRGEWGRFYSVWNCTVADNSATEEGGGINSVFVKNSIVWNNSAPLAPDIRNSDEWHLCSPIVDPGCGSITNNPLFVDAAAGDYRLRPDSPCVNAGANDYVQGEKDIAGNVRIYGSSVDMGAYELLAGLIVQVEPKITTDRRSCALRIGEAKGCRYEVQWTADLNEPWRTVKSWTADKDGEIEVEAIPLVEGNKGFFRLAMPE